MTAIARLRATRFASARGSTRPTPPPGSAIMLTELGAGYVAKVFFDTITGGATAGIHARPPSSLSSSPPGWSRIVAILVGALIDIRHRFSIEVLLAAESPRLDSWRSRGPARSPAPSAKH